MAPPLIVFVVYYSIFSVNWQVVGLLPLYLKENDDVDSVKPLMFWASFGILIGTLISGFLFARKQYFHPWCSSFLLARNQPRHRRLSSKMYGEILPNENAQHRYWFYL